MDRRSFCRATALVVAAMASGGAVRAAVATGMPRCRVRVLRRHCFHDLQSMYLDEPEAGPCAILSDGQEFICDGLGVCPEGMCARAWRSIQPEIERLARGDTRCGVCGGDRREAIACCGDGTRPVIFSIELL